MAGSFISLTLANLSVLDDGLPERAWHRALTEVMADLKDRPNDKTKRTLTLTMELVPEMDEARDLCGAEVTFKVKAGVPHRQTKTYGMTTNRRGELLFSENNPEDPDQATLDDLDEEGRVRRPGRE